MLNNLYNIARRVIPRDDIKLSKFIGNNVNDVGQLVPTYAEPIAIDGVFQPVAKDLYEQLGLDYNKHYRVLYTDVNIAEIDNNASSDRILFAGDTYQALYKNNWFVYNGWVGVLCVRL